MILNVVFVPVFDASRLISWCSLSLTYYITNAPEVGCRKASRDLFST